MDEWMRKYSILKKHVEENGELPSYKYIAEDGSKIGIWIAEQRDKYREGKLQKDKMDLLTAIKGWYWRYAYRKKYI